MYSTAIDAIAHAANVLRNKVQDLAHGVSPFELKERLDGDNDFVLLDVRREIEYEAVHFNDPRGLHIPVVELKGRVSEVARGKEVIILCVTSVRAYIVERTLRGFGYDDVKILDGSLMAWPFPEYLTSGQRR